MPKPINFDQYEPVRQSQKHYRVDSGMYSSRYKPGVTSQKINLYASAEGLPQQNSIDKLTIKQILRPQQKVALKLHDNNILAIDTLDWETDRSFDLKTYDIRSKDKFNIPKQTKQKREDDNKITKTHRPHIASRANLKLDLSTSEVSHLSSQKASYLRPTISSRTRKELVIRDSSKESSRMVDNELANPR